MKNKIFMYLFLFAVLFIIFQYMNEKKIFENQEQSISSLSSKLKTSTDSIDALNSNVADLNYFTLQGNDNAMTYLESYGLEALDVENMVTDVIYDKNVANGGNSLIPFEGANGIMKVNKLKFLNHRWILADFSDGKNWGEMIIEYTFNEKNELQLHTIGSLIYPSN